MASYSVFALDKIPDPVALLSAIRSACGDATAGFGSVSTTVTVKKATAWTQPEITATQTAINACPALTPQRQAQNEIDNWPISMRAFALALVDQLNVLRVQAGLAAVTPAQALAAIRAKAGTL